MIWSVEQSDALMWVIYLIGVFSILSLLFILATIAIRLYHVRQFRYEEKQKALFSELFFAYLSDPENPDVIARLQAVEDKRTFFTHILNYMVNLRGKELDEIQALIYKMGINEMFRKHLRHRDKWQRAYAAYALGIIRDVDSAELLRNAFGDRSFLVQYFAARSIIAINARKYTKEAILKLLNIPYLSQYQVMEGLVELDEEGLTICFDLFRKSGELGWEDKQLIIELFAYKRYVEAAEEILMTLLSAEIRELKIICIRALGLLHYSRGVEVLRQMLKEKDWVIVSQSLRALGRIGDIASLSEFLNFLESDNFWIRYNAGLALYELGTVGMEYLHRTADTDGHPGQEIARQILLEKKIYAA
ncbi:MAG: hypothetical protein Kow0037_09820 [Calditrichia bacterium]